ncbi:hypothetical protein [Streptomyces sp. NPDC004629]|uniref:hypothetical protein n=1 Tax=Streptomyces sp. NPDC004629 TaxID=3364705 RepID=UPI003682B527
MQAPDGSREIVVTADAVLIATGAHPRGRPATRPDGERVGGAAPGTAPGLAGAALAGP